MASSPARAATIADLAAEIPDGRLIWELNNQIYHSTVGDWDPQPIATGVRPRWSPDGKQILYADNDRLFVISSDLSGAREIGAGIAVGWFESGYAWTPDGAAVTAIMKDKRTIRKFDVASGQSSVIYTDPDQDLGESAELRVGGRFLLMFRAEPNHVRVWDLQQQQAVDTAVLGANCTPAWSPDGSYFTNTLAESERPIVKAAFDAVAPSVAKAVFHVGLAEVSASQGINHYSRTSNDGNWVVFNGKQSWQEGYDAFIWKIGSPQQDVVKFAVDGKMPDLFIPPLGTPTRITEPKAGGESFRPGETVHLKGEGSTLVWRYDLAGDGGGAVPLGEGESAELKLPVDLPLPTTLTVTLTGEHGTDEQTHTVACTDGCVPPPPRGDVATTRHDGGPGDTAASATERDAGAIVDIERHLLAGGCRLVSAPPGSLWLLVLVLVLLRRRG